MYIFYVVFLRKMVFDYQKAIKYYKTMLDDFCNSFQSLILKKNDLIEIMKTGNEFSRINNVVKEKKFIKVSIFYIIFL